MSLETELAAHKDALLANTAAVTAHTEALNRLLAKAVASTGGDAGTTEKKTRVKKTDTKADSEDTETGGEGEGDGDEGAVTVESLSAGIKAWMAEFGKEGAEYEARGNAFKATLEKLKAKKIGKASGADGEVKAADLPRLAAWLEKVKGQGKLAAEAEEDEDL